MPVIKWRQQNVHYFSIAGSHQNLNKKHTVRYYNNGSGIRFKSRWLQHEIKNYFNI